MEHSSEGNAQDPGGARANHGDLVVADALATLALTEGGGAGADETADDAPPTGTLAWRMRMERVRAASGTKDELGGEWDP